MLFDIPVADDTIVRDTYVWRLFDGFGLGMMKDNRIIWPDGLLLVFVNDCVLEHVVNVKRERLVRKRKRFDGDK